jgi:pimeloyl-ACP methyl ester carboxylesterase
MTELLPRPDDHRLTLGDGRTLGWVELGDPDGWPLLSCHGGLSSRLDVVPAGAAARANGVRLVSPDRPGVGLSDRRPGRTLLDWAADAAELADHLGLDRLAVLGWSSGGMFAQACAYALPERVRHLGLVASAIPVSWDGMEGEIDRMDRVFMELSGKASPIERTIFSLMRGEAHRRPQAFARQAGAPGDAGDAVAAAVAEGLVDTAGVVDEYRILAEPWGFDPSQIAVPTHVWQGDADDLVPRSWGERLAGAIPGATLTIVPGASHYLWYDRWDEILTALAPG